MFEILFAWPEDLQIPFQADVISEAYRLYRLQSFLKSESTVLALLSHQPDSIDALFLSGLIRLYQRSYSSFQFFHLRLESLLSRDHPLVKFQLAQYLLQLGSISSFSKLDKHFWHDSESFWPLLLARSALSLHCNNSDEALFYLDQIPQPFAHCLESVRLRCRLFEQRGRFEESFSLLIPACERFSQHLPSRIHLLDLAVKARSQDKTVPILNSIIIDFGLKKEFLTLLSQVRLLQNRSAQSRRHILQNRVWNTISPNQESLSSNLYNCYDRLGLCDWLSFSKFFDNPSESSLALSIKENLCMQAASLELPTYPLAVGSIIREYSSLSISESLPDLPNFHNALSQVSDSYDRPLTIAWYSADISYHPVGRFLYGFLNSLDNPLHKHIVVDLLDHGQESSRDWFLSLENIDLYTLEGVSFFDRLASARSLAADIAVDLSGWTSGHFMRGFLEGLAPIQVSYLGYFASTGIPNMNYWLGDSHLFPDPMIEWHEENIWRLNRCFLAWQPPPNLPESQISVVSSSLPSHSDIHFGSFNHPRKLSDLTLIYWGKILRSVPGSFLVLKSGQKDDNMTSTLLSRRMLRAGLDPSRVVWLERAGSAIEHLQQYSLIDVGLDCFPNGGCTTTCEALWMGVPVITLTGDTYVSRMSTAVLHGADLPLLCASSLDHYLKIAVQQADRLNWLRQNRNFWRSQLVSSSLGNCSDLMSHIEDSFSSMFKSSL